MGWNGFYVESTEKTRTLRVIIAKQKGHLTTRTPREDGGSGRSGITKKHQKVGGHQGEKAKTPNPGVRKRWIQPK